MKNILSTVASASLYQRFFVLCYKSNKTNLTVIYWEKNKKKQTENKLNSNILGMKFVFVRARFRFFLVNLLGFQKVMLRMACTVNNHK